jgi:Transposase DDE domain
MEKHRLSNRAFTRNRLLNFPTLVLYLLNLRKHSNQVELDQFFQTINDEKEPSQHITKSAFFQARKQLSPAAFVELNQQLNDNLYSDHNHYTMWKGHRLCAIDGTSMRLPNEPDIVTHFGVHHGKENQADCAMGMASVFYDVLNHIVIDSTIAPKGTSERSCAAEHLEQSNDNDLILYDRGYNAFWLYSLHSMRRINFCMRAKTKRNLFVKEFIESGEMEAIVTLKPNKPSIKTCKEKGLPITPIKLRLVRIDLPNEVEVLITNLLDTIAYDCSIFKSLYHLRWGIEENYKRLKQWVEIENFSGKSALSVQQDFHAKILAMNLSALMAMAAQKTASKKTAHCRLRYQINFAQALSKMKHRIVRLILQSSKDIEHLIRRTVHYVSQTIEAVRAGRSAPRKLKNIKNDIHFPAYKSAL